MLNDSRFYYGLGLVIIAVALVTFAFSFEKRKPRAREIVMLSVMITFGVMGRIIFFMTPQFKPCIAIIIITGIALGKEAGFATGVMTAFISNFFMGQGPWTPWQMIGFGIIGYITGVIYYKKMSDTNNEKINRIVVCVYGFLATLLIYGIIMDTSTVLMSTDSISIRSFVTAYGAGFVVNIIHAVSTFVFLWLLLLPMIKKIKRVTMKYGMYRIKKC